VGGLVLLVGSGAGVYTAMTSDHQIKMAGLETKEKGLAAWIDAACAQSPEACKKAMIEARNANLLQTVPSGLQNVPTSAWFAIFGVIAVAGIYFWGRKGK
jgi:hypothetical protein